MKKSFKIFLPVIIGVSICVGFLLSQFLGNYSNNTLNLNKNDKLTALFNLIDNEYADRLSRDSLIESIIPLVLEKLDPHSTYIVPEEYNDIHDPIEGSFEGIGVQFNIQNDTIIIVQVIPGGPSEMVKIKAGDRIVKVNDSIVAGKKITNTQVMKLLKGPKGTKVKVSIQRKGNPKLIDFVITRGKIPLFSIDASYMVNSNTGYIKISRFAVTTPEEFTQHIQKLRANGMKKVIIDLRENGGGVLQSAIMLANEFLQKNDIIVFTKGKNYKRQDYKADGKGTCQDLQLAVLINEFSASASEVFAGAIQDNDRGIIVGRRSFGKGFVNRDFMFGDSSIIRLTVQKFYSPSGRCIQKPYKAGNKEYENELTQRFLNGELERADSIHFPKSLQYKTKKGRTVYGGGGIMPEYFVPLDTVGYSDFYSLLTNKGIIYDFAFEFADKNRVNLEKCKSIADFNSYFNKTNVFNQLLTYTKLKNIPLNNSQITLSKRLIETQLYALIIRNIASDSMFYQLLNRDDATIKKAEKILTK